jgi:peptidoglycan hydrolase CwlO-like protein
MLSRLRDQSRRFKPGARRAWSVAVLLVAATLGAGAGVAVTGCGGDNNDNVSNVVSSVQGGLSTAQGTLSTAQQKVGSVGTEAQSVQSQVQSVQSQISTATTTCRCPLRGD